jgi:ribosomal protein L11 methyltransferase
MKWIEAKVSFQHADADLAADLIAEIFREFELQGVVVEDPDIEPDDDWSEDAVVRPDGHAVIGYFPKNLRADKKCQSFADRVGQLRGKLGLTYRISYKELDEEDWAEAWKAFIWPRKIANKIVIKPTWREYNAEPDDLVVELDPGMAFGTGTHPTTALCIEMIEAHLNRGDSFLDVGTGSGILMIAASKLGADRVCGVDKDESAVDVAVRNLELNAISPDKFSVFAGDLIHGLKKKYDFIAANILTYVILELLNDIAHVLQPRGIFVCSGILDENRDLVLDRMKDIGFEILEVATMEQWIAIAGTFSAQGL